MLRSKATAALMKLKEIDRKYKIKSNEEAKLNTSLSDISAIDSIDEIQKHVAPAGPGDKIDEIIRTARPKPKLDIRMPETHMERVTAGGQKNEPAVKLVTIFNKSDTKNSLKSESNDISPRIINLDKSIVEPKILSPAAADVEENVSEISQIKLVKNRLSVKREEVEVLKTETSISEDVPEVGWSSHPVSDHPDASGSQEFTLKNVDSIIDADERVESGLDKDPSTLVASGTYSDDFVQSSSDTLSHPEELQSVKNAEDSNNSPRKNVVLTTKEVQEPELPSLGHYHRQDLPELDKNTKPEIGKIVEPVPPSKVLSVVSEREETLDAGHSNFVKKLDHRVNEEVENRESSTQRSSKCFSARSSEDQRRRRRSPRTPLSYRNPSNSGEKTESEVTRTSGSLNSPKGAVHGDPNSEIAIIFKKKNEKKLKNPRTLSFLESQNLAEVDNNDQDSRSPKDEVAVISREFKAKPKNAKSKTRAKDSSKKPLKIYSKDCQTHKYTSEVQPVPVTMVEPVSEFLHFSYTNDVGGRVSRISKHRGTCEAKKPRSNKRKIADTQFSKNRTKGGGAAAHRQYKNRTKDQDPGLGYEARDADRLRQEIKELRLQRERDQLRARVRCYVKLMMNEQQRILTQDDGFRCSLSDYQYANSGTTGLRQTEESLRSFFKPLDLPNVAGFKRPDFEYDQTADLGNEKHFHLRMIHERVLGIRHWLKQQFVLYRDYSTLVSAINAKYIPVTLKETKKMIRDMQRSHNNRENQRRIWDNRL